MPTESLMPRFPPALAGRYRYECVLGSGAMGQVFRAHDLKLDRPVAIKVMRRTGDGVMNERFRREAQALADLDHPGIMKVYDWGGAGDNLYLSTELLEGEAMHGVEAKEPGDYLRWMLEVASALEAVHGAQLLHRDLKPSNIVLNHGHRPVLIDFGLVYNPKETRLTATSAVVGTLACLAPELLNGATPTPEADWYAWGASLYILYYEHPPRTLPVLLALTANKDAPPLKFPGLDPGSAEVLCMQAALSLDPAQRPGSREDCERVARRAAAHPAKAKPLPSVAIDVKVPKRRLSRLWVRFFLGLLFLASLALGVLLMRPPPPATPPPAPLIPELVYLNQLDAVLEDLEESEVFEDPANWLTIEPKLPPPPPALHFTGELLDRAQLLDREWLTRRMPRPIGERLGTIPRDTEEEFSKKVKQSIVGLGFPPPPYSPELLDVFHAFSLIGREIVRLETELHAYRDGAPPPHRMDKSLFSAGRYLELDSLMDSSVGTVAGRRGVLAFLAPGSLMMRRGILALDRAITAEPSAFVRERLVIFSEQFFRHAKGLFYGELAYLDPRGRVAAGGKNPEQEVLVAWVTFRVAKPRRNAGVEWKSIVERACRGLRQVIATTSTTPHLRAQAGLLLTEMLVDLGDREALNRDLVVGVPTFWDEDEEISGIYLEGSVLLEPGDPAVEILRSRWPRYRASLVKKGRRSPRVSRLVAWLDQEPE